MLFPDISDQLDADERGAYVTLLVLAAAVDGRLKSEELAALESVMGRMLMHPDVRAKQRMLLESPPDIKEVLGATTDRVRRLALRDTLLVCAIDGEYSEEEIHLIRALAERCGLDDDELAKLFDWVTEGWYWMTTGRELCGIPMVGDMELIKQIKESLQSGE